MQCFGGEIRVSEVRSCGPGSRLRLFPAMVLLLRDALELRLRLLAHDHIVDASLDEVVLREDHARFEGASHIFKGAVELPGLAFVGVRLDGLRSAEGSGGVSHNGAAEANTVRKDGVTEAE